MTMRTDVNDEKTIKEAMEAVNNIPHRDLNQFEFAAQVRREVAAVQDIFPHGGTPSGGTIFTVVISLTSGQAKRRVTKMFNK